MQHTIIEFPKITIHRYESPFFEGGLFHLYINYEYDGAYMSEESLMNRLSLLCLMNQERKVNLYADIT